MTLSRRCCEWRGWGVSWHRCRLHPAPTYCPSHPRSEHLTGRENSRMLDVVKRLMLTLRSSMDLKELICGRVTGTELAAEMESA